MVALRIFTALIFISLAFLPSQSFAGMFSKKPKKPVLIYGIEKAVYDTLTEDQRKQLVEVYNEHEQYKEKHQSELASLKKNIEALEEENHKIATLEKEKQALHSQINKLQLQIESQEKALTNFLTVSQDLLAARSKGKNYTEKEKREKYYPKITNIHRGFNSTTIKLENDTTVEISPFEKEKIDTWVNGHTVELIKGDGLVYTLCLQNLDTENSVSAKIKEKASSVPE